MGQKTMPERVIIPIAQGRVLKEIRRRSVTPGLDDDKATIRRLVQCVEMMAELTKEFGKKR